MAGFESGGSDITLYSILIHGRKLLACLYEVKLMSNFSLCRYVAEEVQGKVWKSSLKMPGLRLAAALCLILAEGHAFFLGRSLRLRTLDKHGVVRARPHSGEYVRENVRNLNGERKALGVSLPSPHVEAGAPITMAIEITKAFYG